MPTNPTPEQLIAEAREKIAWVDATGSRWNAVRMVEQLADALASTLKERDEAKDANYRAFVAGAKWWEFVREEGGTMWASDQRKVEAEAQAKWPYVESGLLRVTQLERDAALQRIQELEQELARLKPYLQHIDDCMACEVVGISFDGEESLVVIPCTCGLEPRSG